MFFWEIYWAYLGYLIETFHGLFVWTTVFIFENCWIVQTKYTNRNRQNIWRDSSRNKQIKFTWSLKSKIIWILTPNHCTNWTIPLQRCARGLSNQAGRWPWVQHCGRGGWGGHIYFIHTGRLSSRYLQMVSRREKTQILTLIVNPNSKVTSWWSNS